MASPPRPPAEQTVPDEAEVLKRFIDAIESGELLDAAPQDVAVVARLQQALSDLGSISTAAP